MAAVSTSYQNNKLKSLFIIYFDNETFTVTGWKKLVGAPNPPLLNLGDVIWSTVVDGDHEYYLRCQNVAPYAYFTDYDPTPVLPVDLSIDDVVIVPASSSNGGKGTITVNATGSGTKRYSIGSPRQASNVFNNVPPGNYVLTLSRTEDSILVKKNIVVPYNQDLVCTIDRVDCTAVGKNDGKVIVNINNGSGKYSITVYPTNDVPGIPIDLNVTPQYQYIKSDLPPRTYSAWVTDTVTGQLWVGSITVQQPQPPDPDPNPVDQNYGSILYFPAANSFHFVLDSAIDCDTPQGLDNVLLADQRYKGVERAFYLQKFNRCDTPTIQFNSDFNGHEAEIRKCSDDSVEKILIPTMVQQNIGLTQSFQAFLSEHPGHGDQSRIYFNTNALPVPIAVNDNFAITNNADGFDGAYLVVDIGIDIVTNKQYLVANIPYDAPNPTSNITITFKAQTINYNIYEVPVSFIDVPDGEYYVRVRGDSLNEAIGRTEPFYLLQEHEGTIKIECRDNKNGKGGVTWLTGITTMYRVEGHFGNLRSPGGDTILNRNADNSPNLVDGRPTRPLNVWVGLLPPYMFEKLGIAFKCKFQKINAIEVLATEFAEPDYRPHTLFGSTTIKVEQTNWFGPFANTGIGTVVDGGYITTGSGFIKR